MSGWTPIKDNQLRIFKIILDSVLHVPDRLLNDLLSRQTKSIQHLLIQGIELNQEFMINFISSCKTLKCLELELKELNGSWDLLKAIKDHKSEQNWKKLFFSDIQKEDQELVKQIVANHQEILTLTFVNNRETSSVFLSDGHLLEITFKFSAGDRRTIEDFTKVHTLQFGCKKMSEMEGFIQLLNRCPNVKLLKITENAEILKSRGLDQITYNDFLMPETIQAIFNAVKGLEELQIVFHNPDANTSGKLQAIKTHGKSLRKLTLVDYKEANRERLMEEIKIFHESLRVYVMDCPWVFDTPYGVSCAWKK